MPNHITSEIQAPAAVLQSMLDSGGDVDFGLIVPTPPNIETGHCSGRHADGEVCWNEWNRKAWGTKWNGYETVYDGGDILQFQTAWSHPTPVIQTLSVKHPEAVIRVRYSDEDTGNNVGTYWAKNGGLYDFRELSDTPEGYELASELNYGQSFDQVIAGWVSDEPEDYIEDAADPNNTGYYWDTVRRVLAAIKEA